MSRKYPNISKHVKQHQAARMAIISEAPDSAGYTIPSVRNKKREREWLQSLTDDYLKKGGKIETIPYGVFKLNGKIISRLVTNSKFPTSERDDRK